MKLNDLELERLIPSFMREDKNLQGIMYALQGEFSLINGYIEHIKLYANLDLLSEELLDELAWQFNIPEYDVTYDIGIKRLLIKDCLSLHHKRGTVAAVQEVAEKIFGNAVITEWFEYDGQPYHFKVSTSNISSTDEMIERFRRVVKETQNVRSFLESVVIEVMNQMDIFTGGKLILVEDVRLNTM